MSFPQVCVLLMLFSWLQVFLILGFSFVGDERRPFARFVGGLVAVGSIVLTVYASVICVVHPQGGVRFIGMLGLIGLAVSVVYMLRVFREHRRESNIFRTGKYTQVSQ